MKNILIAVAMSIALPAVAHAQTAPATAPKADCCEKMKAQGKECCCKDMAKMGHSMHDMKAGANANAGHDMSQPGGTAPPADSHQNHQQ